MKVDWAFSCVDQVYTAPPWQVRQEHTKLHWQPSRWLVYIWIDKAMGIRLFSICIKKFVCFYPILDYKLYIDPGFNHKTYESVFHLL